MLPQIPTQDFFTNQFGLPLTMDPNFEDLSCEMIYGRAPPHITQDKMYGQPCFVQVGLGFRAVRDLWPHAAARHAGQDVCPALLRPGGLLVDQDVSAVRAL